MKRIFNRYFVAGFAVTLTLILFCCTVVYVDCVCRGILLGDNVPVVDITSIAGNQFLNIHTLWIDESIDISFGVKFLKFFADFICFPY